MFNNNSGWILSGPGAFSGVFNSVPTFTECYLFT